MCALPDLVKQSQVDSIRSGNAQYAALMDERDAFYEGSKSAAWPYIEAWVTKQYANKKTRERVAERWSFIPLLKQVVDTLATAYMAPPSRRLQVNGAEVAPESAEAAAFALWQKKVDLDSLGREMQRRSILRNSTWLWIQWDGHNALPRYNVVSPARIIAKLDAAYGTDIQRAEWIWVERQKDQLTEANTAKLGRDLFDAYQREGERVVHCVVDKYGNIQPGQQFEYPDLDDYPFVRVAEIDGDLYPEGGDDLLNETNSYHNRVAEERWAMHMAAFPQLVISGEERESIDQQQLGPGMAVVLTDKGASASYLTPNGSLIEAAEMRERICRAWLRARNLPADMWSGGGTIESGHSREIQRLPLMEDRALRLRSWSWYESEMWRLTCVVRKAHVEFLDYSSVKWGGTPRVFPADLTHTEMVAIFAAPKSFLTPKEAYELARMEWQDGTSSPVAWMQQQEPGLAEEDALKRIAGNKRLAAPLAPIDPVAEALARNIGADDGNEAV